eukprot:TRINITY_DN1567_c1_g1_i1.p1 TRINITY_DN1567_c1_g1~~TRINITY_DN1567_c1_g1_i1.p1  ORF type:complete len:881 (-),score=281.42 TRINITY_DN1567_c1_g1_i1:1866-4445(-)
MAAFGQCQLLNLAGGSLRVEGIEAWGAERLLANTGEGQLFIYDVQRAGADGYKLFQVGKPLAIPRRVTQMAAVEQHSMLVCLSELITWHDLPHMSRPGQLPKTKGSSVFCVGSGSGTNAQALFLCVGQRRKILIYSWDGANFVEMREIAHAMEAPRSMLWCDRSVAIGFNKNDYMLDNQSANLREISPMGKSTNPLLTRLPDAKFLITRDNVSAFKGYDGEPASSYGISWVEPPASVAYCAPYVLGMLPKMGVDVRALTAPQSAVQVMPLRGVRSCAFKDIDRDTTVVYVLTATGLYRLLPTPVLEQIDRNVEQCNFDTALLLCDYVASQDIRREKVHAVRVAQAYNCVKIGRYPEAMKMFAEQGVGVLDVLGLFPTLLPFELRGKYKKEIADCSDAAFLSALKALRAHLETVRKGMVAEQQQRAPTDERDQLASMGAWAAAAPAQADFSRCTDVPTIVDTAFLKVCLLTNGDAQLQSLLSGLNSCHEKECVDALTNAGKYKELVMLYRSKALHGEALKILQSHDISFTIDYLRKLGREHFNLVMQFSQRVLQANPRAALKIFTEGERAAQDELPAYDVLNLLKTYAPTCAVPFLEYLIARGERDPEFHNDLIQQYLDVLKRKQELPEVLDATRLKLQQFLRASPRCYNAEKMLMIFNKTPFDFYEERALLFSCIKDHRNALQIYAYKLHDFDKAERYCEENYNEEVDGRDVYLELLRVYLNPPENSGERAQMGPALALLGKHYARMDVPKALELLPQDTPLSDLHTFFKNVLQDTARRRRHNQVLKNLLKSENLQVKEKWIIARSPVIKIDENRLCHACNRPLKLAVFAYFPDGSVVHLMCLQKKEPVSAPSAAQLKF